MKRFNILIVTTSIPYPLNDGSKIIIFNLIKLLSQRHNITLLTFIDNESKQYKSNIEKYCLVETVNHKIDSSSIKRLRCLLSILPYGVNLMKSREMEEKVRELLLARKYDLVHCFYMNTAQYIKGNYDLPMIMYATDCESFQYHRRLKTCKNILTKLYLWWQLKRNTLYEKIEYKEFAATIVVSELDRDALLKIDPSLSLHVVPNGVDLNYYESKNGYNNKTKSIVFSGVMDYYPNVSSVLYFHKYIFPIIKEGMPDIKFYIVGRNPTSEIRNIHSEDKNVIVTGIVDDIRQYYENSSVFVCYMVAGSGIKNKLLEAMAMGIPVVANSLAAESLNIGDGKEYLKADKNDEFAQKVMLLLSDEYLAREISKNARRYVVNNHSWKQAADKVNKVYDDVLQNNGVKSKY